ncbi:YrbL family protein [Thalassotalea psychrophila]|uniref:YrbL family protein n=1 Tax=Thalassotalea psychrophila TaxID=3065647 RepID=A0ABY9TW99_9GAMM|nr:YrbL family protein [Colwelliaceae bacterium SQ149]
MIELDNTLLVGKGAFRECYRHPDNNGLCVKVLFRQDIYQKAIRREIEYYERLIKRNVDFSMLSRYYSATETNIGRAHVYELICDSDGQVSQSLEYYLQSEELSKKYFEIILMCLKNLKEYLIKQKILTLTLYPRNLVLQLVDEPKLVIIDDIGNTEFIRFSEFISYLAIKKVNRKWGRFVEFLQINYPNNPLIDKIED